MNDDPSKNPLFSSKPDRLKQGSVDSFENLAPKTSEDAFLFREPLNKRKPPEGFESGSKKPGGLTAMLEEMHLFESNERLSDDAAERIFESSLDSFPNISGENSPSLNSLYAAASRAETNQTTQSRPMRFADQPFDPLPDLLASTDLVAPSLPVRSPSHGYEDDDNFPALSEFRGKQKASIYPYIAAISFFSVTTVGMLAYMLAGPQGAEPTRDGLGASASGVERNIDAGRQSGWEQEPPRTEKTNASAKDGAARAVNAEASKNRRKAVIALGAAAATQQQPALAQAAAIGPNPSSALLQSSIERMPESRAAAPEKEAVKAPSESMAANSAVTNKTEAPPAKIIAAPAASVSAPVAVASLTPPPAASDRLSKPAESVAVPANAKPSQPASTPAGASAKNIDILPNHLLISAEKEKELLERGEKAAALGDISKARLLFEYLAKQGSSSGAYALGQTYDASYLAGLHVRGLQPDEKSAFRWYNNAAQLGNADAQKKLSDKRS